MEGLAALARYECGDEATKFDKEKPRLDLVPSSTVYAIADVMAMGAKKYGEYNWRKGMAWSRPYAAMMRHMTSWYDREDKDSESGLSHLAHAACNLAFLIAYEEEKLGRDDRPSKQLELGFVEDGGRNSCLAIVQRINDLLDSALLKAGS